MSRYPSCEFTRCAMCYKIMALVIVSFFLWSCEGKKQTQTETENTTEMSMIPRDRIIDSFSVTQY